MDIPIFDGSDLNGCEGWINVVGRVLKAGRFPQHLWVSLATMRLEEGVLKWWIGEETIPRFHEWNDFADGLRRWCRHQRTLGRWKYWIRGTNCWIRFTMVRVLIINRYVRNGGKIEK